MMAKFLGYEILKLKRWELI